ncbi:MAG: shikimate dehydrogenase [Marmoricola sp.]|jgi:shikimate dehydrogenase|nr:shikimate dehydrogenase [Marmoricola sp.]
MRCAVLGTPIAHSLSPALHSAAYAHLGLDWTYDGVLVDSAGLADFLDGLDETWRGLSLTMPLKRVVVPMVDTLDDWSRLSGVANTVVLEAGRRLGFNTDIPGAIAAVLERLPRPPSSAVVLGGGATATSVLLALVELGCMEATVLVRDPARAEETAAVVAAHPRGPSVSVAALGGAESLRADLVVSTIPDEAQTPELLAACAGVPAVFEVVYDPWPTPLARAALDSGRRLVSGLDLLAHQAVLQMDLMTGHAVPVELVRDAGRAELARRAGHQS